MLFSMSNNCLFRVMFNCVLKCHNCSQNSVIRSVIQSEPACNFVTKSESIYYIGGGLNVVFVLSSRSTIKAIILAACVSDSLLQTSVASSANLCSVIKVAALLLADGSRPVIKASEIVADACRCDYSVKCQRRMLTA